jgi:bacterioferritin-associated ferredoxin
MLSTISADEYNVPMAIGELKIKFRPLNYRDVNTGNLGQFEMQREIIALQSMEDETARTEKSALTMQKLTKMNMDLIANTVESIIIPTGEEVSDRGYLNEFLQSCDRTTYEAIRQHAVKLREAASTKPLKIKCVNCSHEYEQSLSLNVTDFFE